MSRLKYIILNVDLVCVEPRECGAVWALLGFRPFWPSCELGRNLQRLTEPPLPHLCSATVCSPVNNERPHVRF